VIEIVPATMDHALAIRLRPGDALEIAALGETQESSFAKALARSLWAETYLIDGEPAVLRGVILPSLLGSTEANAWLMSGEPIERHRPVIANARSIAATPPGPPTYLFVSSFRI